MRKKLLVLSAVILTLALTSCGSLPGRDESATAVEVFFPAVPEPGEEDALPISENGRVVAVRVTYEYWTKLLLYMADTEAAVQALQGGE